MNGIQRAQPEGSDQAARIRLSEVTAASAVGWMAPPGARARRIEPAPLHGGQARAPSGPGQGRAAAHATALRGALATGLGTGLHAVERVTGLSAGLADVGAHGADLRVARRAHGHERRRRATDLRAFGHQAEMRGLHVGSALWKAMGVGLAQADAMTAQASIDAGVKIHGGLQSRVMASSRAAGAVPAPPGGVPGHSPQPEAPPREHPLPHPQEAPPPTPPAEIPVEPPGTPGPTA